MRKPRPNHAAFAAVLLYGLALAICAAFAVADWPF